MEQEAINRFGCSTLELMEQAGQALAEAVLSRLPLRSPRRVVVLAGPGKNGGDGLVCARMLAVRGVEVDVVLLAGERLAPETQSNLERLEQTPARVSRRVDAFPEESRALLARADAAVDALLGIGAQGAPREPLAGAISALARARCLVVAADVPSGLDADTGRPQPPTVAADVTVTFGLPKRGLFQPAALPWVGQVRVASIGFPPSLLSGEGEAEQFWDAMEVGRRLPRRPAHAHKRLAGKVLVIGGSAQYHGALLLAGQGAARAGAGFVRLAYPRCLDAAVRSQALEELCTPLPASAAGAFAPEALAALLALAQEQDAVVIGPGLGRTRATARLVSAFLRRAAGPRAVVVDADALAPEALPEKHPTPLVLTPHAGEAGRLLGRSVEAVNQDRQAAAQAAGRAWNAVVLLKGSPTLVQAPGDGPLGVVSAGTQALATAGTGDVLSGVLAALAAQGMDPWAAAACAAYIHGRAGELAACDTWGQGVRARDVAAFIPNALAQLRWA